MIALTMSIQAGGWARCSGLRATEIHGPSGAMDDELAASSGTLPKWHTTLSGIERSMTALLLCVAAAGSPPPPSRNVLLEATPCRL